MSAEKLLSTIIADDARTFYAVRSTLRAIGPSPAVACCKRRSL